MLLEHGVESRNQSLSQPEREDELGASHEKLKTQAVSPCASQDERDVGRREHTLGVRPLKKLEKPSLRAMLAMMRIPLSGLSKLRFWIRVLMTSRGAETTREAEAPAIEATKFWNQEALL